ncbi:hypothetical protein ACFFHM_18440 [Halalkalibacter kiskunsagensis]|uniref:Uncharacterized protein n=1 Tax=Halalkalibacter kiskunsagensis TaxID=1548599 RepID=A0ABV6KGG3_9BACI
MIVFLFCLLIAAFFIELIQKNIFRKKDPKIDELWKELHEAEWFQNLIESAEIKRWIETDKENGLLKDPYYVRKILDKELHREGFIEYVQEKTKGIEKNTNATSVEIS